LYQLKNRTASNTIAEKTCRAGQGSISRMPGMRWRRMIREISSATGTRSSTKANHVFVAGQWAISLLAREFSSMEEYCVDSGSAGRKISFAGIGGSIMRTSGDCGFQRTNAMLVPDSIVLYSSFT